MPDPLITSTRPHASGGAAGPRQVGRARGCTPVDDACAGEVARPGRRARAGAEKVVDDTDRGRDQYGGTYYGRHRHDVVNYDLVVNTERLGIDGAAALVVAEARRRRWG